MINAIVIDDEQHNRTVLKTLLQKYCPEVNMIAEADNADDGFVQIHSLKPQLVFLDVKMSEKSGFDLLKMFTRINFEVIFVSAFDQYAINAFEFNALDYILKPIDYLKLIKAVNKAILKIESNNVTSDIIHFVKTLEDKSDLINKLSLHHNGKVIFVNVMDMTFIEAKTDFCEINTSDNSRFTSSKDLKQFEDVLSRIDYFIRVNKSALININFIKSYSKGDTCIIELKSGQNFEVSRRKKTEIVAKLKTLYS